MNQRKDAWLLPLRCVLFACGLLLVSALTGSSLSELSRWWPIFAVVINLLCFSLLLFLTKGKYQELIHYQKGQSKIGNILLTVAATLVIGMGGMYAAGFICYGSFPYLDKVMVQPLPVAAAVICVLLLPLTTTLAEDGIYLGVIHRVNGSIGATLAAALFYAAQHSVIPLLPDVRFMLYRFLSFLPLTILFCFWYRGSRNPLPFMIGHFMINLSTAAMLMMTALYPNML